MSRKNTEKTIVANWKMNLTVGEGVSFARQLNTSIKANPLSCQVMIAPPATHLTPMALALHDSPVKLCAQNCHYTQSGPYTGELSAAILKSAGAAAVILGHSERRSGFNETNDLVRFKVAAALDAGLKAIICVGESEKESTSGDFATLVAERLMSCIPPQATPETVMVSYEPLWAIGTGHTPSIDRITQVHQEIKSAAKLSIGPSLKVFYGGSVNQYNAPEIIRSSAVDGLLVGGASLNVESFFAICASCP